MAFVINALIALAVVIVFGAAVLDLLFGLVMLAAARKGDRPVEFTTRQAAMMAIATGGLMAWQAFELLLDMSRP